MAKENMFEIKDVCKTYMMGDVETRAVCNVSVNITKGDYTAIVGASGSGKSTLMHMIGCLDTPTSGTILVDGIDISEMTEDELALVRRDKIGFVFQSYNLITSFSAIENVALPLRFAGTSREAANARAEDLLESVGLGHRMKHRPNEMSGGEQQRVAIARAIVNDPDVILADEPTGNLDSTVGAQIFDLLENLNKKEKKTLIIVTHDVHLAERIDKQIRLKDGQIINKGVSI
ncbi:MAG: ABC transporter ATP-binding protein [archaeon]